MATSQFGSFEDVFEQGASSAKQAVASQVASTAKTVSSQMGVAAPVVKPTPAMSDTSASPLGTPPPEIVSSQDDPVNETGTTKTQQATAPKPHDDPSAMTPEMKEKEQVERKQKLAQTRQRLQQLHNQVYYDPTFNRRKKEPSTQERLEQEKQQDEQKKMQDIQEQKKKDEPIALSRAKRGTEMNRGASG